jgi:NAD+-processing family protein with receiver domain
LVTKFILNKNQRVLLLEDSPNRIQWFKERLENLIIVSTVSDAIDEISTAYPQFHALFLDHDLGMLDAKGNCGPEGNGFIFARHLADIGFAGENTVIHSWNPVGAKKMKEELPQAIIAPWGTFEIEVNP